MSVKNRYFLWTINKLNNMVNVIGHLLVVNNFFLNSIKTKSKLKS